MKVFIKDFKLVIITKSRNIYFDLPKKAVVKLKHEIGFIIKHNEFLAEHISKNEISQLLPKYKHGSDIREHGKH